MLRTWGLALFLLIGCGDRGQVTPVPPPIVTEDCMRTFNAEFNTEMAKVPNEPSFLVKLVSSETKAEQTLQADWNAAPFQSNLDLTTVPGDVMLPSVVNAGILQDSCNATHRLAWLAESFGTWHSPPTPGVDSYAWQSFKHTLGLPVPLSQLGVRLYATGATVRKGSFANTFYIQLFDAKNGAALSTLKSIGGAAYVVDGMVYFDFSAENIQLANNTEYWIKVYSKSSITVLATYPLSSAEAYTYIRYNTNTATYTNGQMDGKAVGENAANNIGDAGFAVSFKNTFPALGSIGIQIDLGSVPTVPGEFRIDALTPALSSMVTRVHSYTDDATIEANARGGVGCGG